MSKYFDDLKNAIETDIDYAWAWQCNLAVPAIDEGVSHELANKIAARTMMLFFQYDITKHKNYKYPDHSKNIELLKLLFEEH